ncbi:MAG: hypothetical protein HS113_19350 [Verrucomicrobiales bacterium]|nr:hypothetical protein [Verrucomicrobiales bacterium]
MRISLMFLLPVIPLSLQAQGYGGANAGYGGQTSGWGGTSGASMARVAVAPMGAGGAGQGWGNAGGGQSLAGGFGGGGLHGVTRRTFMLEPNMIAAQFFTSAGVPLAPPAILGANTTSGPRASFAAHPRGGVPPGPAVANPTLAATRQALPGEGLGNPRGKPEAERPARQTAGVLPGTDEQPGPPVAAARQATTLHPAHSVRSAPRRAP